MSSSARQSSRALTPEEGKRLFAEVERRRLALGLTIGGVNTDGVTLSSRTYYNVKEGTIRRGRSLAKIEDWLRWENGSCEDILAGHAPRPKEFASRFVVDLPEVLPANKQAVREAVAELIVAAEMMDPHDCGVAAALVGQIIDRTRARAAARERLSRPGQR